MVDNGRGGKRLYVDLSCSVVPIVDFAFATVGLGVAELEAMSAFAWILKVVGVVFGGDVRGTLPCMVLVLGLAKLMLFAAISNEGVPALATCFTLFHPGDFPAGCEDVLLVPDAVSVVLASAPLSTHESSP